MSRSSTNTVTVQVERHVEQRGETTTAIAYWPEKGPWASWRPKDPQYVLPRWRAEQFAEVLRASGNVVLLRSSEISKSTPTKGK